jgi:hypothetical protein
MTMHAYPSPSSHRRQEEALHGRVQHLLDASLFRQALAEVLSDSKEADPESLRKLGLAMHRSAPRSKDRGCTYRFARAMYREAASHTRDPLLRAEMLAEIGASFFEEDRFDDAVDELETSRALVPWRHHAHLTLLAIACATRDLASIRRRCKDFVDDVPAWHTNREAVASLAADPDFALLRESPQLFFEAFGGYPHHLQALYDRHCLEALERAVDGAAPPSARRHTDHEDSPTLIQMRRPGPTYRTQD